MHKIWGACIIGYIYTDEWPIKGKTHDFDCYVLGAFCLNILLTDHLHLWGNISFLIGVGMTLPPSTVHKGLLNGLMGMKIKQIICHSLPGHQISTQLNTSGAFWRDVLDSALDHHHQHTNWESFGRVVFNPKVQFQICVESKVHWSSCSSSCGTQHLTKDVFTPSSFES